MHTESKTPLHVLPTILVSATMALGNATYAEEEEEGAFAKARPSAEAVVAQNGMVTGTTGAPAQKIGLEILKQGGNAMDAAMATALAQITLAGGSWVSFAGILGMTYYDAETGKVYDLNGEYNTVKGETDPLTIPAMNLAGGLTSGKDSKKHFSGRTVLVPGFMAGVDAGLTRFGKLKRDAVFTPAIKLAEEGFELPEGLAQSIKFREDVLSHWPESKAIFSHEDGSWLRKGDRFRQPELAHTLRQVVKRSASYMYTGSWARKFVETVRSDGGKITLEDMAAYRATWEEPLMGTYGDYSIAMHGLPSGGGVMLLEAMNLVEAADLASMGHYSENPDVLYYLTQIMRNALLDYAPAMGVDMDLSPETRIAKSHARKLWQLIQGLDQPLIPTLLAQAPRHSDAVVVVDRWGNIAAMTHSINAVSWGEYGRFVDGVSIPDSASFQQTAIAAVTPGDRLPAPLQPGIVLKNGKAFMGFSPIGAGLHQRTVTSLINVLDYGMTPQEAINQPAIGSISFGAAFGQGDPGAQSVGPDEFDPSVLEKASRNGISYFGDESLRGYWIGISIDPTTGELNGGTLRRFDGRAVGY